MPDRALGHDGGRYDLSVRTDLRVAGACALALVGMLLITSALQAAGLEGLVISPDGAARPGAVVSIPELALTAVTAADGSFELDGVPDGTWMLVCEGPGLVPTRMPVTVPSPEPVQVMAMDVAAVKEGRRSLSASVDEDSPIAAAEMGGEVAAADAGAMKVQLLCTNCNAASLSMLGLTSDHLDLRVDGVPVFEGIEAVWALSMLPDEAVYKTVMAPGPGTVFSGSQGLAGRMEIETIDPFEGPAFHTEVTRGSYDLWSEEVYARGRITENLRADVVATHSNSNAINPNDDARNEQGGIDRETLTARFHYRIHDDARLRIGLHGYKEDQWRGPGGYSSLRGGTWLFEEIPIERRSIHALYEQDFDGGAWLRAVGLLSDRDQVVLSARLGDILRGEASPAMDLTFDIDAEYEYASVTGGGFLGERFLLEGGLEYGEELMHVFNRFSVVPEDELVTDLVRQKSAFAQGTLSLPHRVDLLLGLRYDDFAEFGDAWSPRLGLRWKPIHGLYLAMGIGKSFRPPRPVFAEVCCGNRYQSNDSVRSETGRAAHLSVAWYPSQRWKLTLAAMRSELDDHIMHLVTSHKETNAVYRNENVPEALIEGIEGGFTFRLDRFSCGASYGLVDASFSGDITTPVDGNGRRVVLPDQVEHLPYVNEETASAFVTWTGSLWEARLQADYSGRQWIQVLDDSTGTDGFPFPELFPTPDFWSVNAQVGRSIGGSRVFLGVDNALDEYQDDFADPTISAKWGLQRGRFWYAGYAFDF